MKPKLFYVVIAVFVMASMLLASCAPAATPEAPAPAEPTQPPAAPADTPVPAAPEPTEPSAEPAEPTEPTEPPMAFEPMSVSAENCDYGGKILDIDRCGRANRSLQPVQARPGLPG
jgi:hypothetical protein